MKKTDIKLLSTKYQVRKLCEDDTADIFILCKGNRCIINTVPPAVTLDSIRSDMTILPPGKKADEKYYIGFYTENTLIAVMDLIDGYPDAETAFIGFFMVDSKYASHGIGSHIISDVSGYFKKLGYSKMKLGFARGNSQSRNFWMKNQFIEIGKEKQADGYVVVEMEKSLL